MNERTDEAHEHHVGQTVTIIVNGRRKEFTGEQITFEQLVRLAFDELPYGENTLFTVTYKGRHDQEGSLLAGKSVRVTDGMIFNVTATDKS